MFTVSVLLVAVVMQDSSLRHARPRAGCAFRIGEPNGHAEGDKGVGRQADDVCDGLGSISHDTQTDNAQPDGFCGQRRILSSQAGID